jgi:ribosome-binding protein aMBF1 (putative translation factor)
MMCHICGEHTSGDIEYRERSHMFLCESCHKTTPKKVSRETFDRIYWEGKADTVPHSTRNEFWDDYKCSTISSVAEYRAQTTVDA